MTLKIGKKILKEVYEAVCSSHIRGCVLVIAVMLTGYYWPSVREDAVTLVSRCNKC